MPRVNVRSEEKEMDEQTALLVFGIFTGLSCLIVAISFAVYVSRSTRD